ncbi:TAT-variant-translocated molybdopterin oxidoreductase [Azospirillum sp. SYSU D00513]|uniref:TAT-variant-translocated molybdopterin oxidoreductase n=1 Tax=Azospirillum sp. SYSU D00513 TaxID=2812561 RepID=UPI001A9571A2|nr:TAT-variant-translocated molybdopterin oxidoreductase [Azospirillum sp. SYSU D00513]
MPSERYHPDLQSLGSALAGGDGPRFWRSLEQLAASPDAMRFLEREFPHLGEATRTDRRTLLKLLGASLALAGLTGCEEAPTRPIVARARSVPDHAPGRPLHVATTLMQDGYGLGILVESHGGRPVKIEGNPLHPASLGATDAFAQAEILTLHDPDRSSLIRQEGTPRTRAELARMLDALALEMEGRGGAGLRLLTGPTSSPTFIALTAALSERFPEARWHRHAPALSDTPYQGARLAFGQPLETRLDLSRAEVILALDADFLSQGPGWIAHAAAFAARRDPAGSMNRLYVAEPCPTPTGTRADHRLPLAPDEILHLAADLGAALGVSAPSGGEPHPIVPVLAEDLRRAGPGALVVAGPRLPAGIHALVHVINGRLGAIGSTVVHTAPVLPVPDPDSLAALAEDMAAGTATHLLILDANPVYDAPAGLEFAERLARLPFSLHLGLYEDETAAGCRWHVPMAHALECWGDARAYDGTASLMQPVRTPRAGRLSALELIASLAGQEADGQALVRERWRAERGETGFEAFWTQVLHDGVVAGTAFAPQPVQPAPPPPVNPAGAGEGLRVAFAPDPAVWDGRYAGNAWLQELPRPLSKLVWGNAVLLAPATAARFGVQNGDVVEVTLAGRTVAGPVFVMPGHAPDTATLPLGYGRWRAGFVGSGVGFSAYALRGGEAMWHGTGATLRRSGARDPLVTTQDHHAMADRAVVRAATLAEFRENPDFARAAVEERSSFYPEYQYEGHAWGMAIDLDACLGCNACMVACQAENNVPVVGREEVAIGREMHWLRVDRYFEGPPDDPVVHFQPMLCMHCEKAPCEVVCPVNATVHDSEGLNVMVYNRCIGTRYCSNNCPYKVRRFNWFDYAGRGGGAPVEVYNPDVTVRERGVMEKCTYCVQRISAARIEAKREGRPVRDGEVRTACQQACPTRAITFGDLNAPDSAVTARKRSPRNYGVLADLNTQPRTTYLARVGNPNPDVPKRRDGGGS